LHLEEEIPDSALLGDEPPYYRPPHDSVEYQYMMERRRTLGGSVPRRSTAVRKPITLPDPQAFAEFDNGSGEQAVSTTMGFTRLLRNLARDKAFGSRVVPIIPDEGRTFGMDALFKELKIYASQGQKYEPVDHKLLLSYTESSSGQILEEGITEAGSMASFIAAGTSYAVHGVPMVPFYTFYSMFGFQRVGDLIWQAADSRARGFFLGATAGRTTLLGEGLQHQDGHSLVLAGTIPFCQVYDPSFAYEVATIIKNGIESHVWRQARRRVLLPHVVQRELSNACSSFNANHRTRHHGGLYKWSEAKPAQHKATILFSGSAHAAARAAAEELHAHFDVSAELWSATSYKTLREEAVVTERWNRLHPTETPRVPRVTQLLSQSSGPIVAVTDFVRSVPEQISRYVGARTFAAGHRRHGPQRHSRSFARSLRSGHATRCRNRASRTGSFWANQQVRRGRSNCALWNSDRNSRRTVRIGDTGSHGYCKRNPKTAVHHRQTRRRQAAAQQRSRTHDRHVARPAGSYGVGIHWRVHH
jgi:pyruvate dehydrogenase E1 component